MAMRRQRIKATANILLNSKRKAKPTSAVEIGNVDENNVHNGEDDNKPSDVHDVQEKAKSSDAVKLLEIRPESVNDTNTNTDNLNKNEINNKSNEVSNKFETTEEKTVGIKCDNVAKVADLNKNLIEVPSKNEQSERKERVNDSDAFKCPPKVGIQRTISHTSNSGIDDVFYSDIEENALQMEKTPSNCPMSPSKTMARPRIKPTPHFGQRRNSFVGTSPSPHTSANEDINNFPNSNVNNDVVQPSPTRRERHHSTSNIGSTPTLHHHTPHKYFPAGITNSIMGRIRTESGCSVLSDTNTSSNKPRKMDDHKQNIRKEFEARFVNGIPERSLIKMSDLIFYNPFSNPIEKKDKPNVKLEGKETSSNDVKPFAAKQEINNDKLSDDIEEDVVPQLKLNAKGELIVDDKSLLIETTAEQEARKALENATVMYIDECTGMNGFYSRKSRTREWVVSDTIKFYRCLQNIGTDFSLMVTLFPNRTRRELKCKFKKEEKRNNHLINKALLYPKQFDIESLKQQMDEEEKLRESQAKTKAKKKKPKTEKKKINFQSKATRILSNGVYQNENEQKENMISETTEENNNSTDAPQTQKTAEIQNDPVEVERIEEVINKEPEKKIRKKKSEKSKKLSEVEKLIKLEYNNEKQRRDRYYAIKRRRKKHGQKWQKKKAAAFIKTEIKVEHKRESHETEFQDTKQLQMEMDDLLNMDAVDVEYDNNTYDTSTTNVFYNNSNVDQYHEHFHTISQAVLHTNEEPVSAYIAENDEECERRTFVNLDDGSLNVYSNVKEDMVFIRTPSRSPERLTSLPTMKNENNSLESVASEPEIMDHETCSSVSSERELNEADIQSILTELAEGSLVLVSSLNPDDPDKVLNEIYMVNKATGELCEEPLKIPDNIVQCILAVLS